MPWPISGSVLASAWAGRPNDSKFVNTGRTAPATGFDDTRSAEPRLCPVLATSNPADLSALHHRCVQSMRIAKTAHR